MKKRANNKIGATQYIALGFLITILIGTFLLKLPISHVGKLTTFDALFVSTSATCVTGLSTVVVADTFSLLGQFVIMCLIQIGGLRFYAYNSFNINDFRKKDYTEKSNFNWTICK